MSAPATGDVTEEEEEFEVGDILNHKWHMHQGQFHYLVQWVGYPDSSNTWEPESNMKHAKRKVQEYWNEHANLSDARSHLPARHHRPDRPPPEGGWRWRTARALRRSIAYRWEEFLFVFA
jgi:hypothetical protein